MADLAYREVHSMTEEQARLRLVMTFEETRSDSEAATPWGTYRQVVRQWFARFQAKVLSGLNDRSHRPSHCPGQTSPHIEEQVVETRKKTGMDNCDWPSA